MKLLRCIALIFCITAVTHANWERVRRVKPQLVGGWREHKFPSASNKFIKLAYQAFSAALGEPHLHGVNLRVSKAATQVVAGLNYKLEVEQAQVSCGFQHPDTCTVPAYLSLFWNIVVTLVYVCILFSKDASQRHHTSATARNVESSSKSRLFHRKGCRCVQH
nr:uncharacterized protein LOC126534429 isoform X1 [Dermacentor andersoni]